MYALISPRNMSLSMECEQTFGGTCPQTDVEFDPQPHVCEVPVASRQDNHTGPHVCDCGATG